ncbi:hypothetical protein RND71_036818 [Anisodus tanguticus]|uniref:Uncharacterized protein n=1 Tax=Anisodus tanguticus TaxID=243964 RepID=A0AAE1R169_9SOLA|nr:hypothetical protein RND71_036818 [Anisodus tanguticus]
MEGKGNGSRVQHVTKASSEELMRKFAEMGSESEDRAIAKKELRLAKRRKRILLRAAVDTTSVSLLPPQPQGSQRFGKANLRARLDLNNTSFFGTIHKTWRRTVQGASKVFIEKHYNQHRRLISDTY